MDPTDCKKTLMDLLDEIGEQLQSDDVNAMHNATLRVRKLFGLVANDSARLLDNESNPTTRMHEESKNFKYEYARVFERGTSTMAYFVKKPRKRVDEKLND